MKREKTIRPFLLIITGILAIILSVLYVDNVLPESRLPKMVTFADALTCLNSEKNELKLSRQDNGRNITLKVGEVILIELERSGSTGYEWYLHESYKENFELVKEDTEPSNERGLLGAPVVRKWVLKVIKKGRADIKLYLYRPWEGEDKAVDAFTIKVQIH